MLLFVSSTAQASPPALRPRLRLYQALTLMGLALLTLGLLAPAQAQTTEWVLTRCNADGSPYRSRIVQNNFYDRTLHGLVTGACTDTYTPLMHSGGWMKVWPLNPYPSSILYLADVYLTPQWCIDTGGSYGPMASNQSNNQCNVIGSTTTNLSGKLMAYFKWTQPSNIFGPYTPADPPPPYMDLLVTTTLSASGSTQSDTAVPPAQLSAVVSASDTTFQEWVGFPGPLTSWTGRHIVRTAVGSNGVATVEVDGAVNVVLTNLVPLHGFDPVTHAIVSMNNAQVNADFNVGATVAQDTRAVTISADIDGSNDSTPTTYKILSGGVDTNGDGLVAIKLHHRDPDGTMKGDIGIPYGEEHTETTTDYFGNKTNKHIVNSTALTITYKAHLAGRWSTQDSHYWWNSSLKSYSLDQNLSYFFNSGVPNENDIQLLANVYNGPLIDNDNDGAIVPNDAGFNGTADHLWFQYRNGNNLDAYPNGLMNTGTEGDNAIATANYYMTVHQAAELFPSHKHGILQTGYNLPENAFLRDMDLDVQSPGYAVYGSNSIDCTWNAPGAFWGELAGAVGVAEHTPIERLPWLPAMLALAHVGLDKIADQGDHQGVAFAIGASDPLAAPLPWDDPASTFPPEHPKTTTSNKSLYWFYPNKAHILYKKVYSLIDSYDQTGFKGENQATPLNIYEGVYSFCGDFKWIFN